MRSTLLVPVAGLVLALSAGLGYSQDKDKGNKDDISFQTYDGVLIKGSFYPSAKGGNAPVVMFLHKFGSDTGKDGWDDLAVQLQQKGYSVLAFDFRGHGRSKQIDKPEIFWPLNRNLINRSSDPKKKNLVYTDFKNGYLPYLLNDIVAARLYLDNRNDNGGCNTSNIIVIGAEEGASLGFSWLALEALRQASYKTTNWIINPGGVNPSPGSDDIAGAIWLSFSRSPLHLSFPYSHMVKIAPALRDHIPMWFAVGQNDKIGVPDTSHMYDAVLRADQKKDRLELTYKKPIEKIDLRGAKLLGNGSTNEDIDKYIKKLVERRPNTAVKNRDAKDANLRMVPLGVLGFGS